MLQNSGSVSVFRLYWICKYFFLLSFMTSLFSNDYLPDRLDITDIDSIAYMEFVETQKRKNDISIIVKIFKFIFRG